MGFGDDYKYFQNKTERIKSATTTVDSNSVKVDCGNGLINYPLNNSIAILNQTDTFNPQMEFFIINDNDLGCQYQHNGVNYLSFLCSADNNSVTAVQYKCGL